MHVFTERPPSVLQQQPQQQPQQQQQGRVTSQYYAAYLQEKEKKESAFRLLAVEQERLSECKRERDRLFQELSDLTREYKQLQQSVSMKTAEQNEALQNKLALARDQHIHTLQDQQQYLAMMLTGTVAAQHQIMDSVLTKSRTLVPQNILQRIPKRKSQAELQMMAANSRQSIHTVFVEEEQARRQQIGEVIQKEIRSIATNAGEARIKVKEIEKHIESCQKQIHDTEQVVRKDTDSTNNSTSSIVPYDPTTAQKRSDLQLKLDTARDLLQTLNIEHSVLMRAIAYEEQRRG